MEDLILKFAEGENLTNDELYKVEDKLLVMRDALKGGGLLFKSSLDLVNSELVRCQLKINEIYQ